MKKIKQLSLFVENRPGTLNSPCKLLSDAGINISTLSVADTKFFGVLRLLVADWEQARNLLERNGYAVRLTDVVAIEVENKAGSLAGVLEILDRNNINVEYMYAYVAGMNGKAVLIFRFEDPESAMEKLEGEPNVRLVDAQTLFQAQ